MDAYKKLYMLGNRPYRPKKGHGADALGEGIGQAMVAMKGASARKNTDLATPVREDYKKESYPAYRQPTDQQDLDVIEGRAVPGPVKDPSTSVANNQALYDRTMATIDKNEAAGGARIGGYFTKSGLEENMKEAQNIGHDKVLLKGMMGTAGQLVSPPPDHMRNYRR